LFAGKDDDRVAIRHASETRASGEWTWGDLRQASARIRQGLLAMGVRKGDRVCAFLPNIPETVAAFCGCASIGAVWSSAAPEFGAPAVIDRFAQLEPKVLLAVDGYRYGGKEFSVSPKVAGIAAALPDARVVRFGYSSGTGWEDNFEADGELEFEMLPFDHPLWVLYSSGTTGLPKGIVHSQGGVLLEHLKMMHFHLDANEGDRAFWFTTTGWMMWNFLVGVLLTPASIVLYDGSPGGDALWELAAQTGITIFGTSAAYIAASMKADIEPSGDGRDVSAIRTVGSTGSPLSPEGYRWLYDKLGPDLWVMAPSGGTDLCGSFVGGVPTLEVRAGEIQAPLLGVDVHAFDESGRSVVGEVGELVVTQPMPSMPICFWNDPDGSKLHESYFEMYPGAWRHGDWIKFTDRGTAIIYGRSDSTINRGGVRIGTSEIYRAVLNDPDVVDALVLDLRDADGQAWMPLFAVLREGLTLDDDLAARIRNDIRSYCSPRHVPDEIVQIPEVPRTLSGKILEVPVKKVLQGVPQSKAASRDSLANPFAFDWFVEWAQSR
jgi:acetoacetyl-CoA synthetase